MAPMPNQWLQRVPNPQRESGYQGHDLVQKAEIWYTLQLGLTGGSPRGQNSLYLFFGASSWPPLAETVWVCGL